MRCPIVFSLLATLGISLSAVFAQSTPRPATRPAFTPGEPLPRAGDEIVVCGQLFHTGTPVVLWMDPGGYDAYRVERRFVPYDQSSWAATTQATTRPDGPRVISPNRYGIREAVLSPEEVERVRGGWDLALLQQKVDQFVIHYDAAGTSRQCFAALHDDRGLSVHFLLDLDGTIYQTLDLKERAWHATISNSRSVGVEIANVGSYAEDQPDPFDEWYTRDDTGRLRIIIPPRLGDGGIRTANFLARPARSRLVWGTVQGHRRRQYDFTRQQYDALIKLSATLCTVLPKIACDYPKDEKGKLIDHKLDDEKLADFHGILGHYHIQLDKADPGPAFQWDRVVNGARGLMAAAASGQHPTTNPTSAFPASPPVSADTAPPAAAGRN